MEKGERETERKERQRNREAENGEGERDREIKNCSLQSRMKRCLSLPIRFSAITINLHSLPDHQNHYW